MAAYGFFLFFAFFSLGAFQARSQSTATEDYIQKYKSLAEEEMIRTGVPAAISLAQGIIESQSGTGWLVEHSHNHFGVKCKNNWSGPTIGYDDDRKNECFRVYATDDSSWRDHSDFLKNTQRYAFLFYLDPRDYKAWAMGLKKAGYATSNEYADKLIHTIETFGLEQYSDQTLLAMKDSSKNDFASMLDRKVQEDRRSMGVSSPAAPEVAPAVPSQDREGYPAGVFRINGLKVLYQPGGTQLISVAEQYHIKLARLMRYNELQSDVLDSGMLIYLENKGKTGAHETHGVRTGESWHDIAQAEGIRLKWLYRRNGLNGDKEPAAGTTLVLQGYAPAGNVLAAVSSDKPASAQDSPRRGLGYTLSHLFSSRHREAVVQDGEVQAPPSDTSQKAGTDKDEDHAAVSYEVRPGDTLYSISKKYAVPVASIRAWNNLRGNAIQTGQKLIVKDK